MTIRSILAIITGDASDPRVLDTALGIGRPNEARVTALYADADPRDIPPGYLGEASGLYMGPDLWQSLENQIEQRREAATDGSAEASRALQASLPFLTRCRDGVSVITLARQAEPGRLTPVLDYLETHGVTAEALYLTERPGGTGAQILETVDVKGAGLLVMGAYTHSRWREMVLGGVTQHIIQNAALPVLFAH